MSSGHEWEPEMVMGDSFHILHCQSTQKSCKIKYGHDFDYCPFCGDEME